MSASGKSLLGLWLYRSGEQEWAIKRGSPIHKPNEVTVNINLSKIDIKIYKPNYSTVTKRGVKIFNIISSFSKFIYK